MKITMKNTVLALSLVLLAAPAGAVGLLVPTNRSYQPLAIKYHRAQVTIHDRAAVTRVEQVFVNNTGRDLEATYIFPLPRGATVSDFYLTINGKRTKGEILERNRARNIYEGIVRRMRDPGLLEYLDHDLFRCRVYPVPRRGEQKIEIVFQQVLEYQGGLVKYVYPMRTDRASARTLQDFTLSVKIESKTPIKTIYSPSHSIYQRKRDDHHAVAGLEAMAAALDRDFELLYTVSDKKVGLNLLAHRTPGEPGFFMLMASPSSELREREIIGKQITFVIDTSGSMAGPKMRHARAALRYCLERLNPDDLFNIVRFSTDVEAFSKHPLSASKQNIARAQRFVKRLEAAGGTAIDEALAAALAGGGRQAGPRIVVFLTDGYPTVGETGPKRIVKHVDRLNRHGAKIFVFGIGQEINTKLLDEIASRNRAQATYVKPGKQIEREVAAFYDKISHPVMTDLELDFGSIHVSQLMPRRLPDLFKGSQVIAFGRYRGQGHSAIKLTGKLAGKSQTFVFEAAFPARQDDNDFIPRLWATRRVGYLLENIRLNGERRELVNEVVRLSKRYGIVTPYTSYLVVEDQPRVAHNRPRPRPRPPMIPRASRGRREASAPATAAPIGGGMAAPRGSARTRAKFKVFAAEKKALEAESGLDGVTMAESVKDLKQAQAPRDDDDEMGGIRYAAGRSFRWQAGVWRDLGYKAGMKVIKVKYLSEAYFELIRRSARLKQVLSLGRRVLVVVGRNLALEVGPQGKKKLGEDELTRLTSGRP